MVWHHLHDERFRALVELSEEYADGRTTISKLVWAARPLFEVVRLPFPQVLIEPPASANAAALIVGQDSISTHMDQVLKLTQISAAPCTFPQGSEDLSQPYPAALQAHRRRVQSGLRPHSSEAKETAAQWLAGS